MSQTTDLLNLSLEANGIGAGIKELNEYKYNIN